MTASKGVSVIICCYNSISRIKETLQFLSNQVVDANTLWEVIVVDNCSVDGTAKFAKRIWSDFDSGATIGFKIVTEKMAGLSYARQKGISEAKYPYLIFCDDDNLLNASYVQNAKSLLDANPLFGIIGGNNYYVGNYNNFVTCNYIHDYAIGEQASNGAVQDITCTRGFVWGAGMCSRKEIFAELKERNFKTLLTDRKGKELSAGGDAEFCIAVRLLDWKIGVSNKLSLIHNVPDERFQFDYLLRLKKGFGKAQPFLSVYDSAWTYKTGKPVPYSYWRELNKSLRFLVNKKKAVYYHLTGRKRENHAYVELHFCFAQIKTLLAYRSKLDKLFLTILDNYGLRTP